MGYTRLSGLKARRGEWAEMIETEMMCTLLFAKYILASIHEKFKYLF